MGRTALFTKTNLIALVAAVGVVVPGSAILLSRDRGAPQQSAPQSQVQTAVAAEAEVRADYVSYAGEDGKNALELLKKFADAKTESSSFGEFVKSINGQDGGGKKYWSFYVNGEMAQVGADAYQTKSSDNIEWKLQ